MVQHNLYTKEAMQLTSAWVFYDSGLHRWFLMNQAKIDVVSNESGEPLHQKEAMKVTWELSGAEIDIFSYEPG